MALPETLHFEKLGTAPDRVKGGAVCFYRKIAVRSPKQGEYYVSGAIPQAYLAPRDLTSSYLIVVPTFHARSATVPGLPVALPGRS